MKTIIYLLFFILLSSLSIAAISGDIYVAYSDPTETNSTNLKGNIYASPIYTSETTNSSAYCGDGVKNQASEECDGSDLNSQTCITQGYDSGTLTCTASCTLDSSACTTDTSGGGGGGSSTGTTYPDCPTIITDICTCGDTTVNFGYCINNTWYYNFTNSTQEDEIVSEAVNETIEEEEKTDHDFDLYFSGRKKVLEITDYNTKKEFFTEIIIEPLNDFTQAIKINCQSSKDNCDKLIFDREVFELDSNNETIILTIPQFELDSDEIYNFVIYAESDEDLRTIQLKLKTKHITFLDTIEQHFNNFMFGILNPFHNEIKPGLINTLKYSITIFGIKIPLILIISSIIILLFLLYNRTKSKKTRKNIKKYINK
jgi:hypothetical protein